MTLCHNDVTFHDVVFFLNVRMVFRQIDSEFQGKWSRLWLFPLLYSGQANTFSIEVFASLTEDSSPSEKSRFAFAPRKQALEMNGLFSTAQKGLTWC